MSVSATMSALALVWLGAILAVFRATARGRREGVGLTLAFLFAMTFEYVGGLAYMVPGYTHLRPHSDLYAYLRGYDFTPQTVVWGIGLTVMGIAAFVAGALVVRPAVPARVRPVARPFDPAAMHLVGLLALSGLVLSRVRVPLPMIDAVQQVGQNAAVVYVCLGAYMVVAGARRGSLLPWLALAGAIPAFYLLLAGFMSFGFAAFVIMSAFALVAMRRGRITTGVFAAGFLVTLYALTSVFVVYMSFRSELRAAIWGGAGLGERLGAVLAAFSHIRPLNPFDFASLDHLVVRLNQGVFVGKVAEYHEAVAGLWLHGQSLVLALVAWIPRAVWPDKPGLGGSTFLTEHTGQSFSGGATFGAGQVVEFYANFGAIGVAAGFFALGLVVSAIDRRAGRALRRGDLMAVALWFTVGLALVRPLSSVFFLVNTALATAGVFAAMRMALPAVRRMHARRLARRTTRRSRWRAEMVLKALRSAPPISRPAEAANVRRAVPRPVHPATPPGVGAAEPARGRGAELAKSQTARCPAGPADPARGLGEARGPAAGIAEARAHRIGKGRAAGTPGSRAADGTGPAGEASGRRATAAPGRPTPPGAGGRGSDAFRRRLAEAVEGRRPPETPAQRPAETPARGTDEMPEPPAARPAAPRPAPDAVPPAPRRPVPRSLRPALPPGPVPFGRLRPRRIL